MPKERTRRRAAIEPVVTASLAPQMAELVPHLPAAIFSSAAVTRLHRAAEGLFPTSGVGFEARLGGGASDVDLCVRVIPEDGSAAILGGWHDRHTLSASLQADPYWQRLARLSRLLWIADDALLRPFVQRFGLEIDNRDLETTQPSIVFFDLLDRGGPNSAGLVKVVTDIVLPLALERGLDKDQRLRIVAVAAAAAPFARLRHVGAALRRSDSAVRLVFWLPVARVGACLAAMGVANRAAAIRADLAAVASGLTEVALQVDIAERLGPRIGVELHPGEGEIWAGLLKQLAIRNLCSIEKAVALASWQRAPAELQQPGSAANYSGLVPDDPARLGEGLPMRLLSHAKLSYQPDGSQDAKVYLYAGFLWRRPGAP
jgi:hypothetical protein